jgi:hypothetical protein
VADDQSLLEAVRALVDAGECPNAEELRVHVGHVAVYGDVGTIADALAELESLGTLKRAPQAEWGDERGGLPKTRIRYVPAD